MNSCRQKLAVRGPEGGDVKRSIVTICLLLWCSTLLSAATIGTSFTYQGYLEDDGNPASGLYDIEFRLFDAETGGAQIGGTQTEFGNLIQEGYLDVQLDFGAGVFIGEALWLEISVTPTGEGDWVTLSPRTRITPAPFSMYSQSTDSIDGLHGSDLMEIVTYDPDGDGKVEEAVAADFSLTSGNSDTVDGQHADAFVQKSGDSMTGSLTLAADPTQDYEAATKHYVDGVATGGQIPSGFMILGWSEVAPSGYTFSGKSLVSDTDDIWVTRAPLPTADRWYVGTAAVGGKVFVMGGDSQTMGSESWNEAYTPETDTWESRSSIPTPRTRGHLVESVGEKIYVIGGESGPDPVSVNFVFSSG